MTKYCFFLKHSNAYLFKQWCNLYVYMTTKLHCLKKIYLKIYYVFYAYYWIIVRRNYPTKLFKFSNRTNRKWRELWSELTLKTYRLHVYVLHNRKIYSVVKKSCRPVETGGAGGELQPLQIFAKVDLLLSGSYSEKKKIAKKQTSSNSSKTTGNITPVHFI